MAQNGLKAVLCSFLPVESFILSIIYINAGLRVMPLC